MTNTTPHRATAEQWAQIATHSTDPVFVVASCVEELRARIEALEAGATCPHVVSSDEGISYCGLAEQGAKPSAFELSDDDPIPQRSAVARSLVDQVAMAIGPDFEPLNWHPEARRAIRAVAEWMRENECGYNAVRWLEREAER